MDRGAGGCGSGEGTTIAGCPARNLDDDVTARGSERLGAVSGGVDHGDSSAPGALGLPLGDLEGEPEPAVPTSTS